LTTIPIHARGEVFTAAKIQVEGIRLTNWSL